MPAAAVDRHSTARDCRLQCPRETDRALERLLACLPEDLAGFEKYGARVPDWVALLERATWHGVVGVLQPYLAGLEAVLPPGLQAEAARRSARGWCDQSRLWETLDEALRAFCAATVSAVALTGPVLSERLYPEPNPPLSAGLDFLIGPTELDRARTALGTIGFREERHDGVAGRLGHPIRLHRAGAPPIALYFGRPTGFGAVMPATPLLARARPYRTTLGLTVHVLAPEDEFLQLALHAAANGFRQLSSLHAIKRHTDRYQRLHWTIIAERARTLQLVRALGYTGEELRHRLGVELPLRADFPAPRGLRRRATAVLLRRDDVGSAGSPATRFSNLVFRALLCDRPSRVAGLLARELPCLLRRENRPPASSAAAW